MKSLFWIYVSTGAFSLLVTIYTIFYGLKNFKVLGRYNSITILAGVTFNTFIVIPILQQKLYSPELANYDFAITTVPFMCIEAYSILLIFQSVYKYVPLLNLTKILQVLLAAIFLLSLIHPVRGALYIESYYKEVTLLETFIFLPLSIIAIVELLNNDAIDDVKQRPEFYFTISVLFVFCFTQPYYLVQAHLNVTFPKAQAQYISSVAYYVFYGCFYLINLKTMKCKVNQTLYSN